MSSEKHKRPPPLDPKKALAQLKKFGIYKDIDGRKTLDANQKKKIRAAYKKNEYVINSPKSEFVVKDVSHYEKKDIQALKRGGYTIINNKVYLDKQNSPSVELKRIMERNLDVNGKPIKGYTHIVTVSRKLKNGQREEVEYHSTAKQLVGWREKLLQQYEAGHFKDGDFLAMKIGAGGVFRRATMLDLKSVYKYLDEFEPKELGTNKNQLLEHVILVKLSTKNYNPNDILAGLRGDPIQLTDKQRHSKARKRSSNKKKTLTGKVSHKKK